MDATREQAAAFIDDTEDWADSRGYTLSDRIWSNRARLEGQIAAMLRDGILRGDTAEEIAGDLARFVNPSYARYGSGTARHAALRLASNETRRAYNLATRDVASTDPAAGYLRYSLSGRTKHVAPHECDDIAGRDGGYGRGVYRANECPLPPRHVGCRCVTSVVRNAGQRDMDVFVEQLRVEYDLADPPDLGPAELAIFRRETAAIRQQVQVMFRAWLDQTGLVSREQLELTSPTVRAWVATVRAQKARRR